MSKVILKGHIIVPNSDLIAVNKELPAHIALTTEEEGCLVFTVTQDKKQKNKFHVYEEFVSAAAFSSHQRRVRDSRWGIVTKDAERVYELTGLEK